MIYNRPVYSIKPPIGTSVDWDNPLSESLSAAFLFNEQAGSIARDISECGYDISGVHTDGWVRDYLTTWQATGKGQLQASRGQVLQGQNTLAFRVRFNNLYYNVILFGLYGDNGTGSLYFQRSGDVLQGYKRAGLSDFALTLNTGQWYTFVLLDDGQDSINLRLLVDGKTWLTVDYNVYSWAYSGNTTYYTIAGNPSLTATYIPTCDWDFCVHWSRMLSDDEAIRFSDNPHALFKPQRGFLFPDDGIDEMYVSGFDTSAPVFSTPNIGQTHILSADLQSQPPIISSPVLGQMHVLTPNGIITGGPVIVSPGFGQSHVLQISEVGTGSPVISTPGVNTVYFFTAPDLLSGVPIVSRPNFSLLHHFGIHDITVGVPIVSIPRLDRQLPLARTRIYGRSLPYLFKAKSIK